MKQSFLLVLAGAFIVCLFSAALQVSVPATAIVAETMVTGTISGKITYRGKIRPASVNMAEFPECAKLHPQGAKSNDLVLGSGNTLANVLIRVKNPPKNGSSGTASKPVVIDQNGCFFSSRVVAVKTGQPLGFKNSDGILHKVHGFPKVNKEFNIGMPPAVSIQQITFDRAEGPFKVKCDVHPWAEAYVAVMTHPYFAVTGENGNFKLDGLPAGTYEIEAWHEKLGTRSAKVQVGDGPVITNLSF